MNWIFIAILAPALYGVSAFVDRFLIDKYIKEFLFLTVLGGLAAFSFGLFIIALNGFAIFSPFNLAIILFSGILFEMALLPYYKAISLEDVSRVVPLFQAIPIFVLIFSVIFLQEVPTINELVGFFLILIGGFILSVEKFDLKIFKFRKFFWYIMLSSFLYALPGVMFKFVVLSENFWSSLAYEFIGSGIGSAILVGWSYFNKRKIFDEIPNVSKKVWAIVYANEGMYIMARFLSFYAISLAPVYLVSVFGGSGPFFTFVYGLILSIWFPEIIKEDLRKSVLATKLGAIILIFIGVWFINF